MKKSNTSDLVLLANGSKLTEDMLENLQKDFNLSEYDIRNLNVGQPVKDDDMTDLLYEVCDYTHSHCNSSCPVHELGGITNDENGSPECNHFKSGNSMLKFIKHGSIATQAV